MPQFKTDLLHRRNRTVQISGIEVSFDSDGVAEVTEEQLKVLNTQAPQSIVPFKKEEEDDFYTGEVKKDELSSEDPFDFDIMTKEQIYEIAAEVGLPEEEYKKLLKPQLIEYIRSKMV